MEKSGQVYNIKVMEVLSYQAGEVGFMLKGVWSRVLFRNVTARRKAQRKMKG